MLIFAEEQCIQFWSLNLYILFLNCVFEPHRLWRDYAYAQARQNLAWLLIDLIFFFIWSVYHLSCQIMTTVQCTVYLSGRVLDLRSRGCGFEPHRCTALCDLVSLSKTLYPLLSRDTTEKCDLGRKDSNQSNKCDYDTSFCMNQRLKVSYTVLRQFEDFSVKS